jgi:hypothetical protein
MALISARSGDVVHVRQGNYPNEATTNVVITGDITLRYPANPTPLGLIDSLDSLKHVWLMSVASWAPGWRSRSPIPSTSG